MSKGNCTFEGCAAEQVTRGYCKRCYRRLSAKGEITPVKRSPHKPIGLRFWPKVDTSGDCWEWQGTISRDGYGRIIDKAKQLRAHRVAWELENGPIPPGLMVLHGCDNRKCVNPDHLRLGTAQENMQDMTDRGRARKTAFTPDQIRYIRYSDAKVANLAAAFNCTVTHIYNIRRRKIAPNVI